MNETEDAGGAEAEEEEEEVGADDVNVDVELSGMHSLPCALYRRRYSNQKEMTWSLIQFGGIIKDKSAGVKDASPRVTTARLILVSI